VRQPILSRRLILEERGGTPDGAGGRSKIWIPLGTLWAEVVARTGREGIVAGRETPEQPYRVTVRGAPVGAASRPRPSQRFREGTRVFNILSVAEADPEGRYLVCMAEERLST